MGYLRGSPTTALPDILLIQIHGSHEEREAHCPAGEWLTDIMLCADALMEVFVSLQMVKPYL